jgi:hypothetical protein
MVHYAESIRCTLTLLTENCDDQYQYVPSKLDTSPNQRERGSLTLLLAV